MDTIFAEATAPGKAGVSVLRVSGPGAFKICETLVGAGLPRAGRSLRVVRDGAAELDRALVLTFEAPASFTGEDVVELHLHGSRAVVLSVLSALGRLARMAEPGEFTRRALENGKLDLAQVEGLADLIDAETEAQRRQAQRVFSGGLGTLAESWREDLIRAAALLEATIDFADEEVPVDVTPEVTDLLAKVRAGLEREVSGIGMAERIRSGFEVAIIGAPNVGKSTLLNALAGRRAAITSEIAGTTRDVIEVRMDLNGLPVTLLDTAGLRDTLDKVEGIGVDLARERAAAADLRVVLTEGPLPEGLDLEPEDIVLRPKADLLEDADGAVSGATGQGVDALVAQIGNVLSGRARLAGTATHARHRMAMEQAVSGLLAAQAVLDDGPELYDIAAEELRSAIRALEALVGRVDVENLLDEIFSRFCLGK
ncbi:tRNA uridine-5-carboxymethylaminomethyl(34) synthesis GTPase MnmE [Marinibacterium profundimaris]|uniref:tRNA modification GTPase MnmE n=1 Tax=Marinibacterium profundimaris TaxID=1679460 RepID=A0A225NMW1_9RHOB|nr:tRNA uridine-5-carboxymethylaminomethyl(34) synthesis GTPase MnmE [Marinibacterium profundimaris]OWU75785.1 tRNA modification GTPase TrmE [Marinibacterium profundimaris]